MFIVGTILDLSMVTSVSMSWSSLFLSGLVWQCGGELNLQRSFTTAELNAPLILLLLLKAPKLCHKLCVEFAYS